MATTTEEGEGEVMAEEDELVLQFLDSLEGYLEFMDSLSSVLRQGWLELAGARHSMGSLRISSALFDLKPHSAATTVDVDESTGEAHCGTAGDRIPASQPHFILSKWGTHEGQKYSSEEGGINGKLQRHTGSCLRHRDFSGLQGASRATDDSTLMVDDQVLEKMEYDQLMEHNKPSSKRTELYDQFTEEKGTRAQKKRSKSLSTFGTLVSPKLRDAQLSFETALESIIQMANRRSEVLSSFNRLRQADGSDKEHYQTLSDTEIMVVESNRDERHD